MYLSKTKLGRLRSTVDPTRYSLLRPTILSNIGIALSISFFAFRIAQTWIEGATAEAIKWSFPSAVATAVFFLYSTAFMAYQALHMRGVGGLDPHQQFARGVLNYAMLLHKERRDPALLRLRNNISLTLHVLGFHRERVEVGKLALESAQLLNDTEAVQSILTDDLGWAMHLLKDKRGIENIKAAIALGNRRLEDNPHPTVAILTAKGHRHLGVIENSDSDVFKPHHFDEAERMLVSVSNSQPVAGELAHINYARALAISVALHVNDSGVLRPGDSEGRTLLDKALAFLGAAQTGFRQAKDDGRFAKSLVLEVRLLEALGKTNEAEQKVPLRDRAVSASVWSRPEGAASITVR